MKHTKLILGLVLVSLMILVLSSCGPKGGQIRLVNESSHLLQKAYISLGESEVPELKPDEWMQASVDKNIVGANVKFTIGYNLITERPRDMVKIVDDKGTDITGLWVGGRCTSGLISVNDGETVYVYVRDK